MEVNPEAWHVMKVQCASQNVWWVLLSAPSHHLIHLSMAVVASLALWQRLGVCLPAMKYVSVITSFVVLLQILKITLGFRQT